MLDTMILMGIFIMFDRFTIWRYTSETSSSEVDGSFRLLVIKWTGFLQFHE